MSGGHPAAAGRTMYAGLALLDRQIDDVTGRHLGKVDDLELTADDQGELVVTALLSGPGALAARFSGRGGRILLALWRLLHPDGDPLPVRTSFGAVASIEPRVRLTLPAAEVDFDRTEGWVRRHVIEAIPGADHAPD